MIRIGGQNIIENGCTNKNRMSFKRIEITRLVFHHLKYNVERYTIEFQSKRTQNEIQIVR